MPLLSELLATDTLVTVDFTEVEQRMMARLEMLDGLSSIGVRDRRDRELVNAVAQRVTDFLAAEIGYEEVTERVYEELLPENDDEEHKRLSDGRILLQGDAYHRTMVRSFAGFLPDDDQL
jgi:rubrerythrin